MFNGEEIVIAMNCVGLNTTDTPIGTCAESTDFCLPSACSDAEMGIDCYCLIDDVRSPQPFGCMGGAQLAMAVPSSLELPLAVDKPEMIKQEMVLSNPAELGSEPLQWELATAGIEGLSVFPGSGILE